MNQRSTDLLRIRPEIKATKIVDGISNDELFQNKTIRPILKLQNDLILVVFKNYIKKHKNKFYNLTLEKRLEYIENAIQRDIKFRNALKGIIIGQFTVEEYEAYTLNSSALNKRMMSMAITRLKDQLQYFNEPVLV
ncbi:glyoxalase [Cellulophaga omnivescoria]|uniref:glyoxalase n=1 Tax=Cellulophaga omnivescoria TaxID=1888890 RepID=UPI000986EA01|nr:glyoxalase [Cellulophaga omnivescoria]WBU89116.1 glyoxalase [Cellulophaga omnivescoria]WKB81111.1 glyoxalase [Cellulophaga lytica]